MVTAINPLLDHAERDALQKIIEYLAESEEADFRTASPEEQKEHIYRSVLVLRRLLD